MTSDQWFDFFRTSEALINNCSSFWGGLLNKDCPSWICHLSLKKFNEISKLSCTVVMSIPSLNTMSSDFSLRVRLEIERWVDLQYCPCLPRDSQIVIDLVKHETGWYLTEVAPVTVRGKYFASHTVNIIDSL